MTEGQWVAAQELSLPSISTIWITLAVSLLPALAWIAINIAAPKAMGVLLAGFAVCSVAVVVGGLVLNYALAPHLMADDFEERAARRRIRAVYDQASNSMITMGTMLVAISLVGAWFVGRSEPAPTVAAAEPAVPKKEKTAEELKRENAERVARTLAEAARAAPVADIPPPAKSAPTEPLSTDEWYVEVIEHLMSQLANPPQEESRSPFGPGFQIKRQPQSRTSMVGVVLIGKFNAAQRRWLQDKVDRARDKVKGEKSFFGMTTERAKGFVTVQGPIADVREFADAVDFGKVLKVDLERRFVVVEPSGLDEIKSVVVRTYKYKSDTRPARGAEVANLLRALQSTGGGRGRNQMDAHRAVDEIKHIEATTEDRSRVARALEGLLNHKDIFTVSNAAQALAVWGDERSVKKLYDCIDHPSGWKINDAVEALGDFDSPQAVKYLVTLLGDRHFSHHASEGLKRMGSLAEDAAIEALDSKNQEVVRHACEVLEKVGGQKAVAKLQKLADSEGRRQGHFRRALDECLSRK